MFQMRKTEYYHEIKHYIKSKIKHPEDAEDLTQNVFLEYYETKDRDNNIQNHKAYLLWIVKFKIADYYRQKTKQPKLVQFRSELLDKNNDAKLISVSVTKEITEDLKNAISTLPPKAKEACELILIDNLSYEEASKEANCSKKVLCKRYYKGLKKLRRETSHISLKTKDL